MMLDYDELISKVSYHKEAVQILNYMQSKSMDVGDNLFIDSGLCKEFKWNMKELFLAIAILSGNLFILQSRACFYYKDEKGKKVNYTLTNEEFQTLQDTENFNHPVTGKPLDNAQDKVFPFFEIIQDS